MEAVFENNCANALIVYGMFIICSYLSGSIGIVRKNVTKDAVMVCICIITHTIFFIIIAPVSHYRGTPRFRAFFRALFLCGEGWWKGRTDCRWREIKKKLILYPLLYLLLFSSVCPVRWREIKGLRNFQCKKYSAGGVGML